MHETSALWKQILAEPDHRKQIKVTINGNEYNESRVIRGSFNGQLFDAPSVGNCFAGTFDLTVMPLDGANGYIPPMSEIRPYVRLVSADGQRVSEYIQKKIYYADDVQTDSDTGAVTIKAFDAMMKMEALFGEPANSGGGGYVPVRYFNVSFNDGFQHIQKFKVASGGALPTPTTPTRNNEKFLSWYPDPANTPTVKGDMRFTARWTPKHTVTFDSNGGTPQTPQVFACFEGDPTPTPTAPEKAGYALTGWNPTPAETVTADATYTAQWEWTRYVIAAYPTKSDYIVGETLDYTGLVVEERFEDGTAARDITANCTIVPAAGAEIAEPGDMMIDVRYADKSLGTFWIAAKIVIASGDWWALYDGGLLYIYCDGRMPNYTVYTWAQRPWYSYSTSITDVIIGDSVTSIGEFAFYYLTSLTSATIPDSVTIIENWAFRDTALTSVTIPNSVTIIRNYAFYNTALTSVTIPDSVTSIGEYAFGNCSSLTSVTIPNGVRSILDGTFESCKSLTSVTIPDSVTSIGEYAFAWCHSLTSVMIHDNIRSIGDYAFACCRSLSAINVSANNQNYSSLDGVLFNRNRTVLIAFPAGKTGSYVIPSTVTSIGNYAFWGCSDLTSVTIPNSVASIGNHAFDSCSSLTSVTIPDSVTSIGEYAFRGCSGLTSVTIPNSVTSIGNYAFRGAALTSVTIPNSVTSIGNYTFEWCKSLTSITIPDSVTSIGEYAFSSCSSLTSVTIPNSVMSIGKYAFRDAALTSVTIPNSVTSIGSATFQSCKSLTSVTIDNGVTSIGDYAFSGCSSLTSVTIPNSVTSIGNYAFAWGPSLTSVTINRNATVGSGAFPSGCVINYYD